MTDLESGFSTLHRGARPADSAKMRVREVEIMRSFVVDFMTRLQALSGAARRAASSIDPASLRNSYRSIAVVLLRKTSPREPLSILYYVSMLLAQILTRNTLDLIQILCRSLSLRFIQNVLYRVTQAAIFMQRPSIQII